MACTNDATDEEKKHCFYFNLVTPLTANFTILSYKLFMIQFHNTSNCKFIIHVWIIIFISLIITCTVITSFIIIIVTIIIIIIVIIPANVRRKELTVY